MELALIHYNIVIAKIHLGPGFLPQLPDDNPSLPDQLPNPVHPH